LDITAKLNDVLHSYYVPAFRLKQDAVPGYIYNAWFNPTKIGSYDIECAEYCGIGHSRMLGKVYVLSKKDFDTWYNSDKKTPFSKAKPAGVHPGLEILESNGCTGCHSIDGSKLVGPSYKGIYGRKVKVKIGDNLKEVVSDDAYLKKAILSPDAEIVDGYSAGMMTSYKDIISNKDLDTIIDYFKTGGKISVDPTVKAKEILESNGCTGCHSIDGSKLVGPSYKGIYDRKVKVKIGDNLKEVVSDDAYLKESILNPDAKIVDGYGAGMMTSYKDLLSDDDISILIKYFKGL